jgi:hypothetical protein
MLRQPRATIKKSKSQTYSDNEEEDEEEEEEEHQPLTKRPVIRRMKPKKGLESLGCASLTYLWFFDPDRCEGELERAHQIMIRKDLTAQFDSLSKRIQEEENELPDLENKFERRLETMQEMINLRIQTLQGGGSFTRADVERSLKSEERKDLFLLKGLEREIIHRNRNIEIMNYALNGINENKIRSDEILRDMEMANRLEDNSALMDYSRGMDLRQYSLKMCKELSKMSRQLGEMSINQQQAMEVELAKTDTIASGRVGALTAVDLLFSKAERVTEQQPTTISSSQIKTKVKA